LKKEKPTGKKEPSPEEKAFLEIQTQFPEIRRSLLLWYKKNSRNYPWRKTGNWFHLLMAEMMLRRTKADQVLPVYKKFTEKYRTPKSAAELTQAEIRRLFEPLGLSWRGRQIHKTIAYLSDHYAKRDPCPQDLLKEIPGVGSYTEAILRNRLFNERCAAVDSNIVRFFTRIAGTDYDPEKRRKKFLIDSANRLMNTKRSFELNLAILDFTALVCKSSRPLCSNCCLKKLCMSKYLIE